MSENAQTVKIHIARIAGLRPCQPCVNRWWKSQAYRPQTTREINSLGSPERIVPQLMRAEMNPKSTPAVNSPRSEPPSNSRIELSGIVILLINSTPYLAILPYKIRRCKQKSAAVLHIGQIVLK